MDRQEYLRMLKIRIQDWGKELSVLEDDIERADEDDKEDYRLLFHDLMRAYEDLEARLNEVEDALDEEFQAEEEVLLNEIEDFSQQLLSTRHKVANI